jgi:hypothetical protein
LNYSPDPRPPAIAIDLGGTPSGAIPAGCRFVGALIVNGAFVGMLVQVASSGVYVQLSGSSLVWLDQQAISEALLNRNNAHEKTEIEPEKGLEL